MSNGFAAIILNAFSVEIRNKNQSGDWLTITGWFGILHPCKTNMTIEKHPFEDVSPIKKWLFSIVMLVFGGVYKP